MNAIWNWPLAAIVIGLLLLMLASHELGIRLFARLKGRADNKKSGSSDEGFILSGVLGLLALLMAFSFSMSLNRFETRRDLMLREASAIGGLSLASKATRGESALAIDPALRSYARARLQAVQLPKGAERANAQRAAVALRVPLQAATERAIVDNAGTPSATALVGAYDVVEDSAVRRDALIAAHLPESVLWLLTIYCIVSAAMLGYAVSAEGSRHRLASSAFYLLLSLAFGTMLDLDRPRSGAITVPQEPFADAVRALG